MTVLFNRAIETLQALRNQNRLLRRRAAGVAGRPPVVLVPSLFGSRLVDERGLGLWGTTRELFLHGDRGREDGVRATGLVEGLTVIPGLWAHDIYGGMVRFLERIGGYRRGVDLFVLDYDWRAGVVAGARALAGLVRQVVGSRDEAVDLLAVSSGGLVARYYLAHGGIDLTTDGGNAGGEARGEARGEGVRRVVYVGTPQDGSFHVLYAIAHGVYLAPYVPRLTPREAALAQTAWDTLPHARARLFVDEQGRTLDLDHFDAKLWVRFGIASLAEDEIARRLLRARRLHEALASAPAHADSLVIGARHLPTRARALVLDGRLRLPNCEPQRDDPHVGHVYQPGDGSVVAASLSAAPGLRPDRIAWVTPAWHDQLPSDPAVHALIVESLIAPGCQAQNPQADDDALRSASC